ncbi:MAG: C_GCAxxG_C_C family protein [Nitrospirae bacterium]|nr:MAG: C_GCAxxG_C_C family protein [Nitrospirota bacterium]
MKELTRRELLLKSSKIVAGAAALSAFQGLKAGSAFAYEVKGKRYPYKPVDIEKVAQKAYEDYFQKWCASTVISGFVEELKRKVGGPWKDFPVDAYRWMHGGMAGWGALCGTMPGAGVIIGLVTGDTDTAEAMVNDLAFYYAYTEMPVFTPEKPLKATIKHRTIAGTPVCHISVGRWMRAEGVGFLTNERAERCARLAASIAMKAAKMLNDWAEGKYKPEHKLLYNVLANGITSQNNCMDCHGQFTPSPRETYETLEK